MGGKRRIYYKLVDTLKLIIGEVERLLTKRVFLITLELALNVE
jgi:hypothetical protein